MSLKCFKYIFITIIILLIVAGIYIIYIKDSEDGLSVQAKNKEVNISQEITIGITGFDTINPITTKNLEIQHITKLIYEPLIDISKEFDINPCIAEEWSKLDEVTYILKLDDNKKWENGKKVTVEDVEFTLKTIKNEETIYKENIENIDTIEKINESTLKIHLKKPVDFFEYLLCFPILEESTYNAEIPMGTGKYKIEEIDENTITIQGNQTKIIIKIFSNATELYNKFTREQVDLIITQNTDYEKYIGNIGFEETAIIGREFYYISCENIKDIETRKAINYNINKEKLIYDLYNQKYQEVDFPLQYGSYLHRRKNIIYEDKINDNKSLTMSVNIEDKQIAEKINEQLQEKNIRVIVQYYQNSKADLILKKETVPITPDISKYFNNTEIREHIDKITKIENKEILKEEYEKIINNYYETQPFISLYFNTYLVLHNNKLKGDFTGNWYNMFYNIDTWYRVL